MNTGPVNITNLSGTNFQNGLSMNITRTGYAPITATGVTVVNSTFATGVLPLLHVPAGVWNITITNPDGRFATLTAGFTVSSPANSRTEIGVFQNGTWYLDYDANYAWSGGGSTSTTDRIGWLGQAGDTPLVGDWNGDGRDEIGIFRNGMFLLDYDTNYGWSGGGSTSTTDRIGWLGQAGDIPLGGDWSGAGIESVMTEHSVPQETMPEQHPRVSVRADTVPAIGMPVGTAPVSPGRETSPHNALQTGAIIRE